MAEIQPFRGWHYSPSLLEQKAEELVSPLFDVISERQRLQLYQKPENSIHLSVPLGEDPAQAALQIFNRWSNENILVRDLQPSVYVYYQSFFLHNDPRAHLRKGFICMIKATDYTENIILRHENTIPGAVSDRVKLLEATGLNTSPTHGLYTDPDNRLEQLMDKAMRQPLCQVEDYQGVTDALGVINDPAEVQEFVEVLKEKQVILADGHHRYESSVQYRRKRAGENPEHTGMEPYNYHMMYLTNTESGEFRILPTHRLVKGLPPYSMPDMLKKAGAYFNIKPVDNPADLNDVITGKKWTFGLLAQEAAWCLQLKKGLAEKMSWKFPDSLKKLDLTVLHYYFIEKVLGIAGRQQRSSQHVVYEKNYPACLAGVLSGNFQMALITNEVTIDEVKEVCYSGFTLPQKSTWFYPKAVAGMVFGSVNGRQL